MTRREVLETLVDRWEALVETYFSGCPQDEIITEALIALDKLEKEKMLEMVGEDKKPIYNESGGITVNKKSFEFGKQVGYNQAKAEIRKKLNLQRGL